MKYLTTVLLGCITSFAVGAGPTENVGLTTPCGYVRVEGVITSIDAENLQLTMDDTIVQVTDNTMIKAGRNLLAFSDLEVGKTVAAVGSIADDVLTAVRINVKYTGRRAAGRGMTGVAPWRQIGDGQGRGRGCVGGCKIGGNGLNRRGCGWSCREQGWGNGRRQGFGHGLRGGRGQACRALALPPADGGTLDEAAEAALREALLDEYANKLYYEALIESFGSSRRFANLIRAEQRHASALLNLFVRYEIEPPAQDKATVPPLPSTLQEAIQVAIDEEQANVAMYDELLESITAEDVEFVFTNLRNASIQRHIPCLERTLR